MLDSWPHADGVFHRARKLLNVRQVVASKFADHEFHVLGTLFAVDPSAFPCRPRD